MVQRPITLFFTKGVVPSIAERTAALSIEGTVRFRNVALLNENDCVEDADAYAGSVPATYAAAYKTRNPKATTAAGKAKRRPSAATKDEPKPVSETETEAEAELL